mgnify:CR=1 FL=1
MHLGLGNSQKAKRFRKFVTRSSTKFDGTDEEITASGVTTLAGASAFTLSGWFKKTDAGHPLTVSYTQNGSNRTSINFHTDSKVYFNLAAGGANYGEFALASTDWVHLVMVFDGTASGNANRLKGYLNGVEQTLTYNSTIPAAAHSQSAIFRIGKDQANGVFSEGSIDEVAIFSSALTAREVDALYNNGQPTKIRTNPNLAHWFRMGEGKLDGKSDGDENLLFDQGPNGGLGSEKVTNGGFSSSSNWSLTGSAEITGGVANWPNATNSSIFQNASLQLAGVKTYRLQYDVVSTNGSTGLRLDGGSSAFGTISIPSDTVGRKSVFLTSNGSQAFIIFNNSGAFVGSIDNVSLREVQNVGTLVNAPAIQADGGTELVTNGTFDADTGWTKGDGWTISGGSASRTAQSGATLCEQPMSFVTGAVYKVTYDLDISAGSFLVRMRGNSNVNGTTRTTSGSYTDFLTGNSSNTIFSLLGLTADFVGSVDNVSVKEQTESVPKKVQNLPSAGSAKSMAFDGTDEFATLPYQLPATDFTISQWINITSDLGAGSNLYAWDSRDSSNTNGNIFLPHKESTTTYRLRWWNGGDYRIDDSTEYPMNLWQHVVLVKEGTTGTIYVDGEKLASATTFTTNTNGAAITMGRRYAASFQYSDLEFDEFAVWDTALDGDAVKALYNAGQPTPVATKTGAYDIYRDNLKAYYKMGDATNPAADGTSSRVDSHLFDQTNPGLGAELSVADPYTTGRWGGLGTNTPTFVAGESVRIDRPASGGSSSGGYVYLTDDSIGFLTEDLVATKVYKLTLLFETDDSNALVQVTGGGGHHQSSAGSGVKTFYMFGLSGAPYMTFANLDNGKFLKVSQLSVKPVNGNTGTITSATIQTEAPKQIYALPPVANTKSIILEGDDEFLQTQVDATLATRYYSFWAKATRTTDNPVFDHGDTTVGSFIFNQSSGKPLLYTSAGNWRYWNDTSAQDDGLWHHWTVYFDSADINNSKLWCDGVEQTVQATSAGTPSAYSTGIRIGRGGSVYFEGSLDEFSIHEELDEEAIRALFNRGRPIDISSGNGAYDQSDKALHWWRMGDATSPAADGTNDIIFQGLEAEDSELITNGDFSNGTTGWTPAGSLQASASDGALLLTHPDAGSWFANYLPLTSFNLVAGRTYKVTFDAQYVSGTQTLRLAYNSTVVRDLTSANYDSTFQTYEAVFTATFAGSFRVFINGGTGSFKIDNVSVKQVRGQYIGPELVTNGGFSADTGWTKDSGWTIANGVANCDGSQTGAAGCEQANTFTAGAVYEVTYDLTISAGSFNVRIGGGSNVNGATRTTSGSYTDFLTAVSGNNKLILLAANATFVGSIDNVSVKEVGGAAVMTNMTTSDLQLDTPY